MKKILLSALLLGSASMVANAQAGSVLVFGDVGYHSSKSASDYKTREFNINPGIGYQFDRNWTVGLVGGYNTLRERPNGVTQWDYTNTYRLGGFVRHTMKVSRIFSLFTQLEAGYQGTEAGNTGSNASVTANGFFAKATPAVGVNIVDGFALNFGFGGLEYSNIKVSGATKGSSSFDVTWGTQFNVGVSKNIFCYKGRHKGPKGASMNHGSRIGKKDMIDDVSED
jgi:hypothetical protein